jgi:hypothetical protein
MENSEKQGSPNRTGALIVHCEFGHVSKSWIHTGLAPDGGTAKGCRWVAKNDVFCFTSLQ